MLNSEILSTLVDQENSDEEQTDIGVESLFLHDRQEFINSIGTDSMTLAYITETGYSFLEADETYWEEVMKKLIVTFNLNYLKNYLNESNSLPDMNKQILDLMIFIYSDVNEYFKYIKNKTTVK